MSLGRAIASALHGGGWAGGEPWVRARLVGLGVAFTALFVVLGHRAFILQVREADRLRGLAEDQYESDVEIPARRGRILDRNGAELAASVEVDSVSANPRQVQGLSAVDRTAKELARALDLDPRDVAKKLHLHRFSSWIKRHLAPDEARAVRELSLPGVTIRREPRRYYPNRALGGPLLGWANVDGRGLEGIELYRDKELRGSAATVSALRDALGRELLVEGASAGDDSGGADVVTTIDKFIQYNLERALEAGVQKSHAKAGVAVVLDPKSGEVLAMASVPTLNPNDPGNAPAKGAHNRAVTDAFEPGSTMKTFSITAAVEAGLVKLDELWNCENGRWQVGAATIHDAEPNGTLTTVEVLAKSSNICTAKIARRSGKERVEAMLRRFGFGERTGIDLPAERAGMLRPVKRWGEVELATISFGQGVTATPLQVALGYAAIANGGTLWKPRITRRIVDEHGRLLLETRPEGRKILEPAVAQTMRTMLHAVTQKGGTADKLNVPGYLAAGKTGTAQKVDPATRRYSAEKWASSFVGFAPLQDPRLVIFVMVDEPTGSHFGSAVAGPIWREVMTSALRYLNVPPTEPIDPPTPPPASANVQSQQKREASARVVSAPVAVEPTETAALENVTSDGEGDDAREIPDFTGLSMGEALEAARRINLPLDLHGTGLAVGQDPKPGPAPLGIRCKVTFAPPPG